MTRKATLPKITECIDPMPRATSFSETRMLQALAAFALLGVLAVAHVHLQFLTTDMKFQQRELQKRVAELLQDQQRLARANEQFCDRQRLARLAQTGHMQEVDPRRQVVAMVPVSLREKYQQPLKPSASDESAAAIAAAKGKVSGRLMGFLDFSRKANAAVGSQF
jgi:hypothetical protein